MYLISTKNGSEWHVRELALTREGAAKCVQDYADTGVSAQYTYVSADVWDRMISLATVAHMV